jgi:hypothetical protein
MYPNEKPKIIHSVRSEMVFQEVFRFERFVVSMIESVEKVMQELSHLPVPPHSDRTFLCVLASPWYASQTRILRKTFDRPTKIEEKFLNEIHEKEIASFRAKEMNIMGGDSVILEMESVQTKLNGYETTKPFGKEAIDFETAMYVSISPRKITQAISDKIQKAFHGKDLHFSSFPFASFVTMRDIFHEKNFLLMDISGETTDVSIIRSDVFQETVSFNVGKNFLIRKIAKEAGSTFAEAASLFRMASGSEMNEVEEKVKKAMKKAGEEWIAECEQALSTILERKEILPGDVFLTADEDVSAWFIGNVQELGNSSFSMSSNVFSVRHLNAPFLSSFCATDTGVERDAFLMVESLFASRLIH